MAKKSGKRTRAYAGKNQAQRTKKRKFMFPLLVFAAIGVILFFFVIKPSGNTALFQNGVGSVIAPLQKVFSTVTNRVGTFFSGQVNYYKLKDSYEDLLYENQKLALQASNLDELTAENERLKTLLDIRDTYGDMDPVEARVIARDPGVWFDSFSINRGSLDGIRVNMPVINADGLIGRVYEVGMTYAKVLTIIDPESAVSTLISRTRDNGVLRGQVTESSKTSVCYMYYIPNVSNVNPGDTVITSGVDTLFPKGLTVGTVTAVSRQTDNTDKYVVVTPNVDFQHIEEVLVLRVVADSDSEDLPVVPTPTPHPIATAKVTPAPTAGAVATPRNYTEDTEFAYPTAMALPTEAPEATVAPEATPAWPEDAWIDSYGKKK